MPIDGGIHFQKADSEKVRLELIDPYFTEGIGKVLTFGAEKYEAWNWQKAGSAEDLERILGALERHLLDYKKGIKEDKDSGESHLYHAACNLMFLDYFDRQDEAKTKHLQEVFNTSAEFEIVEVPEALRKNPNES